jgi:fumarylacetoacetase
VPDDGGPVSWLELPADTRFGLHNLPYGVFSTDGGAHRIGVAVGDSVLDLTTAARATGADFAPLVAGPVLNPLLAAGRPMWRRVRAAVRNWLTDPAHRELVLAALLPVAQVRLHLPFTVGDYVDFYASEQHARNVGQIFRPGTEPLTPNWKHLPIGYHGRSGSVVVSGTPVIRPHGQGRPSSRPGADPTPAFGPSTRLDIEAEVGYLIGTGSPMGQPVPIVEFAERVFGVFLLNDWSARDLQAWEYVPLGPFLGKSFATSVSPWVVPLDALSAARVAPPAQDPQPLPYLRGDDDWGLDLMLEVRLNGQLISRPPLRTMYWTPAQMLAHLTVNGAPTRPGDIYASGTVSGSDRDQRGCLLELSWGGTEPLHLPDGGTRTFLEDGDSVTITATAPGPDGARIGFGEVTGQVRPAIGAGPRR